MKIAHLLVLAMLSQTAAVYAQPVVALPSQAVRTADLDLSNNADRIKLGHRIRIAVNTVCGDASSADLVGQNRVSQCRDETRASVQTQVQTAIAAAERNTRVASAQ